MTKPQSIKLTFEEFRKMIARELEVEEERIVPEASFFSDLCVDSIRMVDMMLRLEELGVAIPLEVAWQIETVGDAYRYCTEYTSSEPQRFRPPSEAAA
ncbi:MAG: acyl carrier protein [Anaerolineae bacterium]